MFRLKLAAVASALVVSLAAGCGGSKHQAAPSSAPTATARATTSAPHATTAASPSLLTPEAQAAATGDIPDNQVFLTFHNGGAGYSIKYPEGWTQQGAGARVTFRDKNNIVRILVGRGAKPNVHGARAVRISGRPALRARYRASSAKNAVTGKRVTLVVDRYYLWRNGKTAVVDLGTPVGVDNVDAYRLMIESFRWR